MGHPDRARRPAASVSQRRAATALIVVLTWTLFAFGGVYDWALWPSVAGVAIMVLLAKPRPFSGDFRWIDAALVAALVIAAAQLMPLPPALRLSLSPQSADYERRIALLPTSGWKPLSLVPAAWLRGLGLWLIAAAIFWTARLMDRASVVRLIARSVAWMGMAASVLTLVEGAVFTNHKMYGFWEPNGHLSRTAGPIVSRNHFASWIVLALPLATGYIAAHIRTHWIRRSTVVKMIADTRAFWLIAAAAMMTAALLVTQSRAGLIGFSAAVTFGLVRGWRGFGAVGRLGLIGYAALLVVAAIVWARPEFVMAKFDQALGPDAWSGRPMIWRESLGLIGRFWLAGVGLAAFDVVMAVYQTATHTVLINHAHNQYLHTMAEGGVLFVVPLVVAIAAFLRLAFRRLSEDHSPLVHIREGALAGMFGLAVQSIWETPLLTPVVFLLLATVAGLAVHPISSTPDDGGAAA